MPAKRIDLTGRRFGKLYVVAFSHVGRNRQPFWIVACDCGVVKTVRGASLRGDRGYRGAQSCGCVRKHGGAFSVEYRAYINARMRCENPNHPSWPDYGGRGIRFRFNNFPEFLTSVGKKPSPELTLDRVNVNGHYEPGNLRWATFLTQSRNQRRHIGKSWPRKFLEPGEVTLVTSR